MELLACFCEVTCLVIANKILMLCTAKEDAEYTFGGSVGRGTLFSYRVITID